MRFCAHLIGLFLLLASPSLALDTIGRAAMVVDQKTGTVLMAKNEAEPLPPASMSKLMTLNMLFEALQDGRVTLDTKFSVSPEASAKGGSKMFLRAGEQVRVEDLIRGIIVQSGNDACIVVAENLAGTEKDFAKLMTARARQLGMMESTFVNATGWPDPGHVMSARDLVFLADRLITQFPEYYGYFAETSFTWAGITQQNRNPLLGRVEGTDGLKTGHTDEAGFGLIASAVQGDRRVIMMVTGLESAAARASESERLITWGFRQFTEETLVPAGKTLAQAEVWLGETPTVPLTVASDVQALIPYSARDQITMSITYKGPLPAPLAKGTEVGTLTVEIPDMPSRSFPVLTAADVKEGSLLERMRASATKLIDAIN